MSLDAITTSAKDVGKNILEKGTSVVKWGSHKVGDFGGFVKDKAVVVMSWVKGFFKNFPQHFSTATTYLSAFVQHIKNNKAYSAGIAGLASAATLGAFAIYYQISK